MRSSTVPELAAAGPAPVRVAPGRDRAAVWLALDTATERCVLALHAQGRTESWEGEGGAQASAALLPQARALLQARGLGFRDLTAVVFGRGPGAFTGLRTACSVAQGLALAAGCPVVPVDSLMLVAEQARAQRLEGGDEAEAALDVGVVMDARMGELYAARYRWQGRRHGVTSRVAPGGWDEVRAPVLCDPAALEQVLGGWPDFLAGSGLGLLAGLGRLPPQLALNEALPEARSRAAALARLGERLIAAGQGVPPEAALPLYLRDKVALTTAERRAAADAAGQASVEAAGGR